MHAAQHASAADRHVVLHEPMVQPARRKVGLVERDAKRAAIIAEDSRLDDEDVRNRGRRDVHEGRFSLRLSSSEAPYALPAKRDASMRSRASSIQPFRHATSSGEAIFKP